LKWGPPQKSEKVLEGFCPEPRLEEQIVVNANGLMLCLRLADIEWLEAGGNCVSLHVGKETHVLRDTLAAVAAKMPAGCFLRINSSTLVNCKQIKGLQPMSNGKCGVLLHNGTRLALMCACCEKLRQIGVGTTASTKPLVCSRFSVRGPASN
jgi:two-component system LytT family response regulator